MTGLPFDPSAFLQPHVLLAAAGAALVVFLVALAVGRSRQPKPKPVDPLAERLRGPEDTSLPLGALPTGMHIFMMPRKADGALPWIPLEVKNCRQDGSDYEIGCHFIRPPSWNTLMHLG